MASSVIPRPTRRAPAPAEPAVTFDELEVISCVYGPGTRPEDRERMSVLGEGWARGVECWQDSGAPYLLLCAHDFDGASRADPTVTLAHDRRAIERAIWASTIHADTRLCLLETFEPSLRDFVRTVIAATRGPVGQA